MDFQYLTSSLYQTLTAGKDGPTLFEVCDPVLANGKGDPHLRRFYRTALGNPALRLLLRRAGLPELRDSTRHQALSAALTEARDQTSPDWSEVGEPIAELIDTIELEHPKPPPAPGPVSVPDLRQIEGAIRASANHLLQSYRRNGFIPTYAAFNLIGDPDLRGREFQMALSGLNARGYKNSTLMFNLARVFIARSPARRLISPPWKGIAEPMWEPVQIRHRSAYYDAFFTEALLCYRESGLASPEENASADRAIGDLVNFCLRISREEVLARDGAPFHVITALAPPPHPRFSRFFAQIKQELGFDIYVPDCDTTACSLSAGMQAGADDPVLDQPLLDFYAGYQIAGGANEPQVTVPLNDHIDYEGGVVTWIDNLAGQRPYGNDLDPTLNLDVLEVSFRALTRWKILETPARLTTLQRIIGFQHRLVASGAFKNPRSHIYYLPELYCAYFGRCYASFMALPAEARQRIDPTGSFEFIRQAVLGYVQDEMIPMEMNAFDAALALIALGHLGADIATFGPAVHCIVQSLGEGGRRGPFKAYEWNKMKTPTRILVGGPEVTSAFALMGLALARKVLLRRGVS